MKSILLIALFLVTFYVSESEALVIRNCTRFNNKKLPVACPSGTYRWDYTCLPYCSRRVDQCTCTVIEPDYDVVWWMYWPLTDGSPFDWQIKINGKCMQKACQTVGGVRVDENYCNYEFDLYNCGMFGPKGPSQCPPNSDAWMGHCLNEACPAGMMRDSSDWCKCWN